MLRFKYEALHHALLQVEVSDYWSFPHEDAVDFFLATFRLDLEPLYWQFVHGALLQVTFALEMR
jgi:hypothetical protein